jgi:anti-anti-sigma factor
MAASSLHVYKTGKLTVIGFDGRQLNDAHHVGRCRDELLELIDHHDCQVLVVDLSEVGLVSSWILGILAAIRQHGVAVELYHPSPDMRGVLSMTHLDDLLHVRHELRTQQDDNSESTPVSGTDF